MRPHRRQPTRLPRPCDSPGKNTGVGCHFLLQCMKGKSESEIAQSCPTPSNPMGCSPPSFSVHGIFQARVLEWGAIAWGGNFLLQGEIPCYPGIEPASLLSPALAGRFFMTSDTSFSSVQSLSRVRSFATPSTAAHQGSLSITISWSLLKLMSFESVMPSNHLILCHPLLLLPSIFPSTRVLSNESALCIR